MDQEYRWFSKAARDRLRGCCEQGLCRQRRRRNAPCFSRRQARTARFHQAGPRCEPRRLRRAQEASLCGIRREGRRQGLQRKRIYVSGGRGLDTGYVYAYQQKDANSYGIASKIPTKPGAGTSFWSPELDRYYVAAPAHDNEQAAVLVFEPQP